MTRLSVFYLSKSLIYPLLSVKGLLFVVICLSVGVQTLTLTTDYNFKLFYQMSLMGFSNEPYDLISIIRVVMPYLFYVYYFGKMTLGLKLYHQLLMNRLNKTREWFGLLIICQIHLAIISGLIYYGLVFAWLSLLSIMYNQPVLSSGWSLFISSQTFLGWGLYLFSCICLGSLYTCIQAVCKDEGIALVSCFFTILLSGFVGGISSDVLRLVFNGPIIYFNRVASVKDLGKLILLLSGQILIFNGISYYKLIIKGRL